ncbi:uncharacterized protein LOC134739007 isoform X2 [Pongo pygmaeus]|uniref:uncharacterized protein LOC134739007 isoform X2 n=1 Tax=Pongo pygmaeus TaxID=9600 RepID=UPI00300D76DE
MYQPNSFQIAAQACHAGSPSSGAADSILPSGFGGIQRIPRDQMRTQSSMEELSFAATCCVPSQEPDPAFKELNGWEYGESYKAF